MYTYIYIHAQKPGHCNTLQQTATHWRTLQNTATHRIPHPPRQCSPCCRWEAAHCNTLQHSATRHTTLVPRKYSQCWQWLHTAINCNTLQYTALYWSLIQHTVTRINLGSVDNVVAGNGFILQYTATHCHTLQHTGAYCNTLQHACTWAVLTMSSLAKAAASELLPKKSTLSVGSGYLCVQVRVFVGACDTHVCIYVYTYSYLCVHVCVTMCVYKNYDIKRLHYRVAKTHGMP